MKSNWYILCIVFVHMHLHTLETFDYTLFDYTFSWRENSNSDYVFAENKDDENLLIFKMDKPSNQLWLTGASLGGLLGLLFAQYRYPIRGRFPNKAAQCVLIGASLGAATCALINAYLAQNEPLKVSIIDANLTADKAYYAVSGKLNLSYRPYTSSSDPGSLLLFAMLWLKSVKGGTSAPSNSIFFDRIFEIKKVIEGNYSGDIKKDYKKVLSQLQ